MTERQKALSQELEEELKELLEQANSKRIFAASLCAFKVESALQDAIQHIARAYGLSTLHLQNRTE